MERLLHLSHSPASQESHIQHAAIYDSVYFGDGEGMDQDYHWNVAACAGKSMCAVTNVNAVINCAVCWRQMLKHAS